MEIYSCIIFAQTRPAFVASENRSFFAACQCKREPFRIAGQLPACA
jgi:hypothetical protein